jgi:hypothetical protein
VLEDLVARETIAKGASFKHSRRLKTRPARADT